MVKNKVQARNQDTISIC